MNSFTDMEFLYAIGTLPGVLDGVPVVNGPGEVFHLTGKAINAWKETRDGLTEERKEWLKRTIRNTYLEGKNQEGQLAWLHKDMDLLPKDASGGMVA